MARLLEEWLFSATGRKGNSAAGQTAEDDDYPQCIAMVGPNKKVANLGSAVELDVLSKFSLEHKDLLQ